MTDRDQLTDVLLANAPTSGNHAATKTYADQTWFEELGRTTLGSTGNTITVSGMTARKYLRILVSLLPSGGTINGALTFNNDTATNYAYETSFESGAVSVNTTKASIVVSRSVANEPYWGVIEVLNWSTAPKLVSAEFISRSGSTSSTAPSGNDTYGKWVSNSQVTRVDITNSGVGTYDTGSEVVVLGHD